jgi:hypothetical protein
MPLGDDMDMTPGLRRKVLRVSPELLVAMCKTTELHCYRVTENALPADAKIVGVWLASSGYVGVETIDIIVESETFERVPIHEQPPLIEPAFENVPKE